MKQIIARTARLLSPAIALALLAGCAAPVMKTSPAHVRVSEPATSGSIPSPVQLPAILPRPRATVKPETYSVVVNNVRVQELLFALARDAKINVDIHPGISGVVTLNAIDQTLPQLLSRISKQTDMRWELDGPNLAVMPDSPFLRIYRIDLARNSCTSRCERISRTGHYFGGTGYADQAPQGGANRCEVTAN